MLDLLQMIENGDVKCTDVVKLFYIPSELFLSDDDDVRKHNDRVQRELHSEDA
jgi:hypothetical protein